MSAAAETAPRAPDAPDGRRRIRVLIADDHAVLRQGLRLLLEGQRDMEVVGEASTGAEAVELAGELKPDVVLLDISMPEMSGIQAIEKIREVAPATRSLVLTMHDDQAYVRSVLAAGGAGYVVKKSAHSELLAALRCVSRGRAYISVSFPDEGLEGMVSMPEARPGRKRSLLSKREIDVLREVAFGYTNKQIAERLAVGLKTVETYRSRLNEKLKTRHRADLVRYALEMGLLRREP